MTGEGLVISVYQNTAVVQISKSSACGHDCASCGACSNPKYEIKLANTVGAKKGDRVLIESSSSKILGITFIVYILPVFLMIVSGFMCEAYSLGLYSIIVFSFLAGLWIALIKLANKKLKTQHTILKVLSKENNS